MITYGAAKALGVTGNKLAEQVAAESAAAVSEIFSAFNDAWMLGMHAFKTEGRCIAAVAPSSPIGVQHDDGAGKSVRLQGDLAICWTMGASLACLAVACSALMSLRSISYRGQVAANSVRNAARDRVDLMNKKACRTTWMQRWRNL